MLSWRFQLAQDKDVSVGNTGPVTLAGTWEPVLLFVSTANLNVVSFA